MARDDGVYMTYRGRHTIVYIAKTTTELHKQTEQTNRQTRYTQYNTYNKLTMMCPLQ